MNAGRELATEEIREQKATIAAMSARIAALEAELAKRDAMLDKKDSLLREALPHLHHTGATHHQQCACSVKRRIEAMIQLERKDSTP